MRSSAADRAVTLWDTGTPLREFLHVDDLADALLFLMQHYSGESHVNVGVGQDLSIRELAELVREVVGFEGEFDFDTSKPDDTPRKLVDTSRINTLGWRAKKPLRAGLEEAYAWFVEHHREARI
jgi:GDP-L-fucose synthase